jgi:heme-binding NEAT domain protein
MAIETQERAAEARARTQSESPDNGTKVPPMRADDTSDGEPVVETPVEARQGFLGKPVLIVLVTALILAVIAGIAIGYIPM